MNIPKHIVLFPDGNIRWAKKNGFPIFSGYKKGYENIINFCHWCRSRKVKVLTIFGFSSENWQRSGRVVRYLMSLIGNRLLFNLKKYVKSGELKKMGLRIRIIGDKEKLPKSMQKAIKNIEEITKNNSSLFLNLAISYGGKWDILNAVKNITKAGIPAEKIDEKLFESYLSTAGLPDPDLIIRAGGELRLSNFALWQLAYSELYFCPKFWPEFTEHDLDIALDEFDKRSRRFGK